MRFRSPTVIGLALALVGLGAPAVCAAQASSTTQSRSFTDSAAALGKSAPHPDLYAPGRKVVADIGRIVTPNGVQETFTAVLGGTRQVVNVRGADRANPILLFIHGGPAAPEMPIAWAFQRPWEDFFTVVEWDQRGSGRSFPLEDTTTLAPTLSVDRYRDDAIELIELLRRKYGKRKVFVLGHSWGSIVGLSVAAKRSDLLYAYIGVGQVIDFQENERVGFEWTLDSARKDGNAKAVRELEALRPYPGPGAFDISKMTTERNWSIHYGALAAYRDNADFYFDAGHLSPEYGPADLKAWDDGSAFTIRTLFPKLGDVSFEHLNELDVPVILFLGAHDYTTPSSIAADWLRRLTAPKKLAVWFEHSAHLPMMEEPGKFLVHLVHDALPLAEAGDGAPAAAGGRSR
ncbi:MAG TPA: alpha/beta hydrolase [Gemmatimonadaceae bacterium]